MAKTGTEPLLGNDRLGGGFFDGFEDLSTRASPPGEQNPEAQLLALREYAARRGFTQDPPRYRLSPARPAASPARQEGQTRIRTGLGC